MCTCRHMYIYIYMSIYVCVYVSVVSDSLQPPMLYSPWNSPGQNTGVGGLSLLQGTSPTHGSNPGLPHCRQILHQLSHQGSPRILEWGAYPFSSRSSWPKNQTRVSFIAGGFFTNWASREAPRHMYIYIHMSMYVWACVYVCIYICIVYLCIHVYVWTFVCMCLNIDYCVVYTRNGRSEDNMAKCSHWLALSGWWCQGECSLSFCMS